MILEAKNLSFRYEESGRKILDQFSLQVDSWEFWHRVDLERQLSVRSLRDTKNQRQVQC